MTKTDDTRTRPRSSPHLAGQVSGLPENYPERKQGWSKLYIKMPYAKKNVRWDVFLLFS